MEDSKNALFVEPNAYINNFNVEQKPFEHKQTNIKKVVFSEPYDCMPNFRINNNFKKRNCDCVKPHKPPQDCNKKQGGFNFDFKTFLPLLAKLNLGGNSNMNSITNLLSNFGSNFDFNKLFSNPELIQTMLKMFNKPKNFTQKEEIICTDYEIKNYTKV